MPKSELQELRRWVSDWQAAGLRLEELRRRELPLTDTKQSLLNLADAFESCRLHFRPAPTSGLVLQQEFFARLR
jgi:hypothetical protein